MKYKLDDEERDILEKFELGELPSVPDVKEAMEAARKAARATFNKTGRVNGRLTEKR